MLKIIYKLKPGGPFNIGEVESWLSYMSEKGWHVKSVGGKLAKFTKGEPMKIKYRIDISSKSEFISDDQIAMYQEYGWTYIDNWFNDGFRRFYLFSSPEELNAPELHTDPVEQSFTLKDLNRNLRDGIILNSILMVMAFLMFYSMYFRNDVPYRNLVDHAPLSQFLPLILMTYFFIGIVNNYLRIKKLKKKLSQGIGIDHNANWRPAVILARSNFLFTILVIASLLVYANQLSNKQALTDLPLDTTSVPIVFLSDIEVDKNFTRHDPNSNVLYVSDSIFTTVNYLSREKGKVINKNNTNKVYNSSLTNTVYKVRFKWLVPRVVEDMLTFPSRSYEKIPSEDFDLLYVNEAGDTFDIISSRGHGIIQLKYTGKASLDDLLNALCKTLELLK